MLSGAISTDNVLENISTSSAEDMDEDSVNLEYHAEKQEVDEPSAVTGDNTTPNQRQTRKVKIDETLNIEFEFAPDSTEVSFDIDSDTPMQVIQPTEDQDVEEMQESNNSPSALESIRDEVAKALPVDTAATDAAVEACENIDITALAVSPDAAAIITSIPTPSSSASVIDRVHRVVTQPENTDTRAVLQEMASFGITQEQATLLAKIDEPLIQNYIDMAYSMIQNHMSMIVERVSGDFNIESIPICDSEQPNQCLSADKLPPLGILHTRGSDGTNSTTTSQFVHGLAALLVSVECKVLPQDTEVLKDIVAGLETNRRKTEDSDAVYNLCEILHKVDKERQVVLVMEASLRLGLLDEVVERLLIKFWSIHNNLKVLIVTEAGLHPIDMASINRKYDEDGKLITAECGGQKNPRDTSVEISGNDRQMQADIDSEASVLKRDLMSISATNEPLPFPLTKSESESLSRYAQLKNGVTRGLDSNNELGETIVLLGMLFGRLSVL